jgi:hydroxylamine dehydrogenase
MKEKAKNQVIIFLAVTIAAIVGYEVYLYKIKQPDSQKAIVKSNSKGCVQCHGYDDGKGGPGHNPAIVKTWESSLHAKHGVGCLDCHGFTKKDKKFKENIENPRFMVETSWDEENNVKSQKLIQDGKNPKIRPDIWEHEGQNIVTNVTPRTCGVCHKSNIKEYFHSRHSNAAIFIENNKNYPGKCSESRDSSNSGCTQCHGSKLRINPPAKESGPPLFPADVWPNTGIGRVNMDGSWGSCSACHSRHEFSAPMARRPDNCGKCHTGPAHPQIEIYYESKHGTAYRSHQGELDFGKGGRPWILGKNYFTAPTCSTCHMGAVNPTGNYSGLRSTHEVGSRIAWTLRPEVSYKTKRAVAQDGEVITRHPDERRGFMKQVCFSCHTKTWVENHFIQYENAIETYNENYAKPAIKIYDYLNTEGIADIENNNEQIDRAFFNLWHFEGKRARNGAAMMGPDYMEWQGFYELDQNFHTNFIPLAHEISESKGKKEQTKLFIENVLKQ